MEQWGLEPINSKQSLGSLIFIRIKVKGKSLSRVQLFATLWTVAHQAPPSMGFFRQEYWSGLPFPSPGESSQPRDWTEVSYTAGKCFTIWATLEAQFKCHSREISVLSMNLSVNWACWGTSILTYKMIMLIMMLSPDRRISVILRNDGYGYNAKIIIMLNKISNTRLFAYWVYSFPKQYMRKVGKENNANFS